MIFSYKTDIDLKKLSLFLKGKAIILKAFDKSYTGINLFFGLILLICLEMFSIDRVYLDVNAHFSIG